MFVGAAMYRAAMTDEQFEAITDRLDAIAAILRDVSASMRSIDITTASRDTKP